MESTVQNLEGVNSIEVEMAEDGIKLHLTRHDNSGVVIDLEKEEFEALEHCFMITESKKTCRYKNCEDPQSKGTKYCMYHREPRVR